MRGKPVRERLSRVWWCPDGRGFAGAVPLDVPLRIWGHVTGIEGRRVSAVGGITTVAEPDVLLVEAEARFARLHLDQARRLFSRLASPDAANPDVAHD